jgi:hypothetical protein
MINTNYGPIYATGNSFRARAEARQRQYRTVVLKVDYSKYGHNLTKEVAWEGANFVSEIAFKSAYDRYKQGKGVSERTFVNMLSS